MAELHFPGATEICDLYHARGRLNYRVKQVLVDGGIEDEHAWRDARLTELDQGASAIDVLLLSLLEAPAAKAKEEVRKAVCYFDTNSERMRYGEFRAAGLFVGSGVIEADCKSLVHRRLKQSGMR